MTQATECAPLKIDFKFCLLDNYQEDVVDTVCLPFLLRTFPFSIHIIISHYSEISYLVPPSLIVTFLPVFFFFFSLIFLCSHFSGPFHEVLGQPRTACLKLSHGTQAIYLICPLHSLINWILHSQPFNDDLNCDLDPPEIPTVLICNHVFCFGASRVQGKLDSCTLYTSHPVHLSSYSVILISTTC